MADLQNAVARGDASERDKADHRGDGKGLTRPPQRRHRADERQRHARHDDACEKRRAVASKKDREDERERDDAEKPYRAARFLLRLECTFKARKKALRESGAGHLTADVGDGARHVGGAIRVGEDDDPAFAILAQDLVRPVRLAHIGDLTQWNPALRRLDEIVAQRRRATLRVVEAHHHVKTSAPVHDARHRAPVREPLQLVGDGGGLKAVQRRALVIDGDLDLRNAHLPLHLQIDKSGHFRKPGAQLLGSAHEAVEILAEHLQGDLRAHARKHVVEPV